MRRPRTAVRVERIDRPRLAAERAGRGVRGRLYRRAGDAGWRRPLDRRGRHQFRTHATEFQFITGRTEQFAQLQLEFLLVFLKVYRVWVAVVIINKFSGANKTNAQNKMSARARQTERV